MGLVREDRTFSPELRAALLRYAACLSKSEDVAEDLVSDAQMRLWRVSSEILPKAFPRYAYMTVNNLWRDEVRHRKRAKNVSLPDCSEDDDTLEFLSYEPPDANTIAVEDALKEVVLDWKHVDVRLLRALLRGDCLEETYRELVQEGEGNTEACLKTRVYRFRKVLRKHAHKLVPDLVT